LYYWIRIQRRLINRKSRINRRKIGIQTVWLRNWRIKINKIRKIVVSLWSQQRLRL
jgi:hypothetical protein